MNTPGLELSNIALKQHHYLPEPKTFNLELEPITHKPKHHNIVEQKMAQRQKELQIRKQLLENSQKIRREILLQKIEAKNQRFQLRKKYQKENARSPDAVIKTKNKPEHQERRNSMKQKQSPHTHQIYSHQNKLPFSNSNSKPLKNPHSFEVSRKSHSTANPDYAFKQVKLVKLPQLNSLTKPNSDKDRQELIIGQVNEGQNKKKLAKSNNEEPLNPLLKVHDTRYFGIEERCDNFEKIGKSLLKQIRSKYWCFDSLEDEEVYDNFEDILLDEMA